MKHPYKQYLLVATIFFVCACNNTIPDASEKIKAGLVGFASQGLNKDRLQKVDSISIIRIDSLTGKSVIAVQVETIKQKYEDVVSQHATDSDLYQKSIIMLGMKNSSKDEVVMITDARDKYGSHMKETAGSMLLYQQSLDSINNIYAANTDNTFWGYRVEYRAYIADMGKTNSYHCVAIMFKDHTVKNNELLFDK